MSSKQTDTIEMLSERLGSLQIINKVLEEIYKQSDEEMSTALIPAIKNDNRQVLCQRVWSQIQDGLMGTEQSLKTGGEKFNYFSKATGSWRLIIELQ